jgi:hypothetical protein
MTWGKVINCPITPMSMLNGTRPCIPCSLATMGAVRVLKAWEVDKGLNMVRVLQLVCCLSRRTAQTPLTAGRPIGPVRYTALAGGGYYPGSYLAPHYNRPFINTYPRGYTLLFVPSHDHGSYYGNHWAVYSENTTFVGYGAPSYYLTSLVCWTSPMLV